MYNLWQYISYVKLNGNLVANKRTCTFIWCGDNSVWQYVFFGFRIKWWRRQRSPTTNNATHAKIVHRLAACAACARQRQQRRWWWWRRAPESGIATLTWIFMLVLLFYVCSMLVACVWAQTGLCATSTSSLSSPSATMLHTKLWTFCYTTIGAGNAPAAVSINIPTRKINVEIARATRRGPEPTHIHTVCLSTAQRVVLLARWVHVWLRTYNMVTCQINPYDLIYFEFPIFCTNERSQIEHGVNTVISSSMSSSPSPCAVVVDMHVDCYYIL